MPTSLSDQDVANIVIKAVEIEHPGHDINPNTAFDDDLGEDGISTRKYFALVRRAIVRRGCSLGGSPDDFQDCMTVQAMIDITKRNTTC